VFASPSPRPYPRSAIHPYEDDSGAYGNEHGAGQIEPNGRQAPDPYAEQPSQAEQQHDVQTVHTRESDDPRLSVKLKLSHY
jgi:hypothetical protein